MELQCWGIVLSVIEVPNGEVSAITETDGQTDRYMVIEEWSRRRRDSGWVSDTESGYVLVVLLLLLLLMVMLMLMPLGLSGCLRA
uniref:Small membrane protein n=1 Tax=Loa loa TaxID=7209 RepID=A0A1I7VJS2_LOALO